MRRQHPISENQARLPFSGSMRRVVSCALERRALSLLGLLLVVAAIVYGYAIIASVAHVAAKADLVRQNSILAGEVAALEAKYLAASKDVTPEYAHSLGYVSPSAQTFLERGGSLTLRDAR